MRALLSWIDKVQEPDRGEVSVNDLAYKPDGSELLVASGTRILVYDGVDGTMLQALRGHKDTVYCVAYSHNGERFASGAADRSVIIWTEQHEGILKYKLQIMHTLGVGLKNSNFSHGDAIQSLSFCPTTSFLVSCAVVDFGLWTIDQKSVNKHKTIARICSCSWTRDGQYFALGMANGMISLRTRMGEERSRIERPSGNAIWSICFNPNKPEEAIHEGEIVDDVLAVADWTPAFSFYTISGNAINKERPLDFDPCCVDYFTLGEFLVMGGSNKQVTLHTREGIRLGLVCDMQSWVLVCKTKPNSQYVAVGCQDGTVACYQLTFSTVHGLHKDRYAFRENMTDVVVQHLLTDKRIRIKCRDLVKKVAIYRNKLAVQLSDRVVIYQLATDTENEMNYRATDKIVQNFECSLLVVCGRHIILCQEKRLQCYDFRGLKEREWVLEALIRYIKVVGGPTGREALLVGLKNGQVLKIFVDNPFPVEMLKIKSAVRCLDLSLNRERLAVVDEHSVCLVYDLKSKELLFQEPHANSVAWNTQNEDLLCFSGSNLLSIKARDFPLYQQHMQGFVVGFTASRVFCLHMYTMSTVEVPLSNQLYQYLERGLFQEAYLIACLGVTESDWDLLALEALEHLDLATARKAFIRTRNLRFLELIYRIEEARKRGETDHQVYLAEVNAYQGKLAEAAKLFQQSGHEQMAMDMYTDLRMFDKAQELLSSASADTQRMLIRKRADWARSVNELKTAAEMYVSAGDYDKAVTIMAENQWTEMLLELARKLDKTKLDILNRIAKEFANAKAYKCAAEVYEKMGDTRSLVHMHVAAEQWQDAFSLADQNPQFRDDVYLPYAHWLAERDRFEDAQKAFHKAGRQQEALNVLEQLTENAVRESRFNDAGYYYWMLSMQYLERANEIPDHEREYLDKFRKYQKMAEIYYAYHAVHRFTDEPFTSYQSDALLNISRFVLHSIRNEGVYPGVSRVSTLYTLGKQGKTLGAYKLARHAFEKLQQLRAPARFQQVIDSGALQIRAKPFQDAEELLPVCYRCSTSNPLLNNFGNICVHCKAPFVFSFVSFEVLPVVEFRVEDGVSDQEAKELIEAEPPLTEAKEAKQKDPFKEKPLIDPTGSYKPVLATRAMLLSLNRTEVIVCEWTKPLRNQYFRNMIPEISITKCSCCNRLFHTDDYELAVLQAGHCPFCRKESMHAKNDEDEEEHGKSDHDFQ